MKILILNGSPKGESSSTLKLSRALVDGMKSEGDELDEIDLSKYDVNGCRGCFACWATAGICVIRDDFFKLFRERYLTANIVIWSFPLYFYEMPSKLKAFMDRLFVNDWPDMTFEDDGTPSHPTRWPNEHLGHIVVSTCGFYTAEGLYDAVLPHFRLVFRDLFKEAITCGEGGCFMGERSRKFAEMYLEKVKKAGEEYREAGEFSKETREALMLPIIPSDKYVENSKGAVPAWKYKYDTKSDGHS